MSPLVERIFTASRITVRLAPNFLPSSASMGRDFPAGRSPRTMDEPSFCTSDWVRLMLPAMLLRYHGRARPLRIVDRINATGDNRAGRGSHAVFGRAPAGRPGS